MKLIAVLICFFFMTAAQAESPNFKVLTPAEYKKLSKPQQIEYIKEFAKRMGTSKRKPARSSNYEQPSKLQTVLADILGLPMAYAEDDIATKNWNERKAADEKYKKEQEGLTNRTKSLTVSDDDRVQLETEQHRLAAKKSVEESAIERKLDGFNKIIVEKEKAIKTNSDNINKVQSEIMKLELVNTTLTEQLGTDGSVAITKNSDKIEVLNEKLKVYTEREKELQRETRQLQNETAILSSSSRDPKLQESLKANSEKLSTMEKQLTERNVALKKMAELNKEISGQAENIAETKKAMEKLVAQRKSLQEEKEYSGLSDGERETLITRIQSLDAQIKDKEKAIESTKQDARRSTFKLDNLAQRAGVEVKVDENLKVTHNDSRNQKAKLTTETGEPALSLADQKKVNTFCSRPNLSEEQQVVCALAQKTATKTTPDKAAPGGKAGDTAKPGDTAKAGADKAKATPISIEKAAELCPHAGFVMMLDETNKDIPCPAISSVEDINYVGKITQGPAAKASCKGNKDYSVEQSTLCQPMLFGLTKDDNGICVAPGQDVTKRCYAEATNKKSFDKAWEIVKANPKAYNEWLAGVRKMCEQSLTTNTARLADTTATCKDIALSQAGLDEAKKRSGTPATPAAAPTAK